MRKYQRWAACLATVVLATVAAIGAPASAAPAPAPTTTTIGTSSYSYDPATGMAAVTELSTVPTTAAVGTLGGAPPPRKCAISTLRYKIYSELTGYVYLDWLFNYKWCWIPTWRKVVSMEPTDRLTIHSTTIRWTRAWSRSVERMPALVVRVLYDGAEFQYCPVTSPGGANCILAFHPKIDLYFQGTGNILDNSIV